MQLRLIIKFKKLYSSNNRMTTLIQTFGGNIGIGTNDPGSYRLRVDGGVRVSSLEVGGISNAIAPTGLIGIWKGLQSTIPAGWVICDGTNNTPDLRNKFIRGASGDAAPSPTVVNTEGGSDNATLTEPMLASHSHTVSVTQGNTQDNHSHGTTNNNAPHYHQSSNAGNHRHNSQGMNWRQAGGWINNNVGGGGNQYAFHAAYHLSDGNFSGHNHHKHNSVPASNANHVHGQGQHPTSPAPHAHQGQAANIGNGDAIPVINPYYALYYIMKT